MRKKVLEEQINTVIKRNNDLYNKCNNLGVQLIEKENLIRELQLKVEAVMTENDNLKNELDEVKAKFSNISIEQEILEVDTTTVDVLVDEDESDDEIPSKNENITSPVKTLENNDTLKIDEVEIDNITNLKSTLLSGNKLDSASSAIGRVVLKCTDVCNTFVSAGDINSKDLVNLALGRTEVFKSEVLSLATSNDISLDMFNAELKLKETSVIEYFELLLKQI